MDTSPFSPAARKTKKQTNNCGCLPKINFLNHHHPTLIHQHSSTNTDQPTPNNQHRSPTTQHRSTTTQITGINLPLSVTKAKVEYTISEEEFVRRWASHILPPGFIRVQHYGATSRRRCKEYLAQCRKLLGISEAETTHANGNEQSSAQTDDGTEQSTGNGNEQSAVETHNGNQPSAAKTAESKAPSVDELEEVLKLMYGEEPAEKPYEPTWKCTKCGKSMQCLEFQLRPSWRVVFERLNHQADKDTQQWLWSLNELHALRGGANPNGSLSAAAASNLAEAATQNSESLSLKALTSPAILDSS